MHQEFLLVLDFLGTLAGLVHPISDIKKIKCEPKYALFLNKECSGVSCTLGPVDPGGPTPAEPGSPLSPGKPDPPGCPGDPGLPGWPGRPFCPDGPVTSSNWDISI